MAWRQVIGPESPRLDLLRPENPCCCLFTTLFLVCHADVSPFIDCPVEPSFSHPRPPGRVVILDKRWVLPLLFDVGAHFSGSFLGQPLFALIVIWETSAPLAGPTRSDFPFRRIVLASAHPCPQQRAARLVWRQVGLGFLRLGRQSFRAIFMPLSTTLR